MGTELVTDSWNLGIYFAETSMDVKEEAKFGSNNSLFLTMYWNKVYKCVYLYDLYKRPLLTEYNTRANIKM